MRGAVVILDALRELAGGFAEINPIHVVHGSNQNACVMNSDFTSILSVLILCSAAQRASTWTDEAIRSEDFSFRIDDTGDIGFGLNESLWMLEGSAQVNDSEVVLTSDARQIGSVWHRSPLDAANWEVEIEFRIPNVWLKADGFGFLYTEKPQHGRAYGAALDFVGLVVAVDTFQNRNNEKYPCPLTIQIFNGSQELDLWADGVDTAIVAHPVSLDGDGIMPVTMRIRYQDYSLGVWLTVGGSEGPNSYGPFRIDGVYIPKGYYLGFGAFCGDFWNRHSVVRFEVRKLDGPDDTFIRGPPRIDLLDSIHGNPFVVWNYNENGVEPSNGIVLDLVSGSSRPIYLARIYEQGRYVVGLYTPVTGLTPRNKFQNISTIEVLSFRQSRKTVISWTQFTAEQLETPRMLDRMVAVGYSADGDILYICKAPGQKLEGSLSRIGTFSLSSGTCVHLDKTDAPNQTSTKFSILLTP